MKKVSILFLMIFLSVFLTACSGNDNIRITEEESDAIAQYCSYLLIKYDKNHQDSIRLLDKKNLEEEIKERQKAEEEANRPKVTPSPVPTPTPEPDAPVDQDASPTPESGDTDVTAAPEPECESIAEAGGIEGFAIEYVGFSVDDSITNTEDFFSYSALNGKKLCLIKFSIKNTSSEEAKFDAVSYNLAYKLTTDAGKSYNPKIAAMVDGIQFYDQKIKPGSVENASLLFEINSDEVPKYLEVQGEKKFIINFK